MYWNYREKNLGPQAVSFVERMSYFRASTLRDFTV